MNNKNIGNKFEEEVADYLNRQGYFVHRLADGIKGQPFDIIAVRGKEFVAIDCKVCSTDRFSISRIEENQHNAAEKLEAVSPYKLWFYFKFSDNSVYGTTYGVIKRYSDKFKKKSLTKDEIMFMGITLGVYADEH